MILDSNKLVSMGQEMRKSGIQYKLGAKGVPPNIPTHIDCSGFVRYCYLSAGVNIPDGTYSQFNSSYEVKELHIGDVGFLQLPTSKGTNHIGIYVGDGKWMHCNYSRNGVTIEKTNMFKYKRRFNNIEYKDGDSNMANIKVSDKEKEYGISAIRRLAELGYISNPDVHISNLKVDASTWALWVVQVKLAEKLEVK